MMHDVLIPRKIKNYYISSQRIIGFDIGKVSIHATQVLFNGTKVTVEKFIEEPLAAGTAADYAERVTQGIKNVLAKADRYQEIYTALNSSVVVFKEIKLPFTSYEKIKMVIDYEVEPLLPFSLQDAVLDFIITKIMTEDGSAQVLAAAVQNQFVAQHIAYFEAAGVSLDRITVDMFALYDLYKRIPTYAALPGGVALIELGMYTTRIGYIQDGQLRGIRSLNKGLMTQVKSISEVKGAAAQEILEDLRRFGFEKDHDANYGQTVHKIATQFWHEINFTLQSFTGSLAPEQAMTKIILLGDGAEIKGLTNFVTSMVQIPCTVFQTNELIKQAEITIKNKNHIPASYLVSMSTVLSLEAQPYFNLRQKQFAFSNEKLFTKQVITASVLVLFIIMTLGINSFIQVRRFKTELNASRDQAIKEIKARFPRIPVEVKSLEDYIDTARLEVNKEEKTWFAFSSQARSSFLKYLLELTSRLDKPALGLTVERITMADDTITLKAHVRGHEELKRLQRDLRQSKMFSIEPQLEPDFTMKITLISNGEES